MIPQEVLRGPSHAAPGDPRKHKETSGHPRKAQGTSGHHRRPQAAPAGPQGSSIPPWEIPRVRISQNSLCDRCARGH
eukprot:6740379-Pyramimonas_sp.AAC.1